MFSLFTGLCAVAQGYWDLLAYRTLAGIRAGRRVRHRHGADRRSLAGGETQPRASAYVGMGWQLGVLAAAFLTPLLLEHIGWRGMFLVGLLPALASF